MVGNPRPKTPNMKDDISDENVYNTLLQSWNNGVNTPKTKIINNESNLTKTSTQHFVTPTKISNFNINVYQKDNLEDKANLSEDNVDYYNMILNPIESFDNSKTESVESKTSKPFPSEDNEKDFTKFEIEKFNSSNELSLNPKIGLTQDHLNKSVSANDMATIIAADPKTSLLSNNASHNDNNIVSKNKLSIYKQFKKFNWNDLTPKKTAKERKMSFESNSATNFNKSNKKAKNLLERSDTPTQNNGLLLTPLSNQNSIINHSNPGSLNRPQIRSNGSQVLQEPNEVFFDNSPFDDAIPENIFNSDSLKRRSLNPRSSFSSNLDIFNLSTNDIFNGNQNGNVKGNEDILVGKNTELSRRSSTTSNLRDMNFEYLNDASDGINNFTSILEDSTKDNISAGMVKNMTPPIFSKKKSLGFYNYQNNSNLRSKSISVKSKVILLEIPYTNDNFDQVLGITKIIRNLKKVAGADIEWVLTMTYIIEAQEDILINNLIKELKTNKIEAKKLIDNLKLKNETDYLELNSAQNCIIKEHPELTALNIDNIKSLKVRLLNKQPNVYDLQSNTNSRYSSITTTHDGGEIIRQPIIGEIPDDISTVHSGQSNRDDLILTSELNAPYLPVSGSSHIPKHLTVRLFDYKHFNQKQDLASYLKIIEKVFTNEDFFLGLWNNAMKVIDNDNIVYQEYNFKNKTDVDGIAAKIHFYKPSNEIQLVVDEYFTAYNKKNFYKFKRLSCCNEDEISKNGGSDDHHSYVDCYEILTKIYQGDKSTLYV